MPNPFSRAYQDQADYYRTPQPAPAQRGALNVYPTSQQAPLPPISSSGNGPAPASPIRKPSPYTPGSLFWLLSGGASAPSQQEYLMEAQQRQKDAVGQKRAIAYQKLSELVSSGLAPQKAFLKFVNTPEGMDFVMTDPDPEGAVSDFLKISTPPKVDPELAIKQGELDVKKGSLSLEEKKFQAQQEQDAAKRKALVDAFGGGGGDQPGQPDNGSTVELFPEEPDTGAQPAGAATNDHVEITIPEDGQKLKIPRDQASGDFWREQAKKLAAGGLMQEANAALTMAKQLDDKATGPGSPADLKAKQTAAMVQVQIEGGKEAFKAADAARKVIPTLDNIVKLSQNVPGGYKGALAPYIAKISATFGWPVDPKASDAEALNALNQQLLPLVRQPGQVSNYEQQVYQQALPSLLQSREGRIKIAYALKQQGERASQVAQIYEKYIGTDQLQSKLNELANKNVFDEETNKLFQRVAKGEKIFQTDDEEGANPPKKNMTNSGPRQLPVVTGADDYKSVQPGHYYKLPDGTLKRKRMDANPASPGSGTARPKTRTGGSY